MGADDALVQLQRILSSSTFARMSRLTGFLSFLVEETIADRQHALCEYEVGVRVFRRNSDYHPRTDSIVRVEARRLRKAVERYYESEGQNDSILIEIPKGSYVPSFSVRETARRAA